MTGAESHLKNKGLVQVCNHAITSLPHALLTKAGTVSYYYRGHLRRIDVVDNLCQTRASVNVDLPNSLLGKREYSIFAEDGENPLTPEDGILCDDVFITEDSVKLVDNEYVAPAPSEGLLEDMEIVAEEAEEADEEE